MLTTIKVYAYYTAEIHKNKQKKIFKWPLSSGSSFVLSTFGSWYSDAVLGTVRLNANKIEWL